MSMAFFSKIKRGEEITIHVLSLGWATSISEFASELNKYVAGKKLKAYEVMWQREFVRRVIVGGPIIEPSTEKAAWIETWLFSVLYDLSNLSEGERRIAPVGELFSLQHIKDKVHVEDFIRSISVGNEYVLDWAKADDAYATLTLKRKPDA